MNKSAELRMPEVGESIRMCGRLVEIQDVTPPVTTVLDYIFEETTATILIKANGLVIKEGSTFNDFYGSARDSAIREAKKMAAQYGDGVEVVVVEEVKLARKRPTGAEAFYAKGVCGFKPIDHGCRWNLPDDVEKQVWSSKCREEARSVQ